MSHRVRKAKVDKDTWKEFEQQVDVGPKLGYKTPLLAGFCGLCGNHGYINITGRTTPAGVLLKPVVDKPCICPNGRAIKFIVNRNIKQNTP